MRSKFDLHTHTTASSHAYSSLKENMEAAAAKGLLAMGTSDHSSGLPGGAIDDFFYNYKVLPKEFQGMRILRGVEANIMNHKGKLDVKTKLLKSLDYVIASLHQPCLAPAEAALNTEALIKTMENPFVGIIGHPDDSRYPLDYKKLVKAAAKWQVALEVNNSSLRPHASRQGAAENYQELLYWAVHYEVPVILDSDAHICFDVGELTLAEELIEETAFPHDLVVNYREDGYEDILTPGAQFFMTL